MYKILYINYITISIECILIVNCIYSIGQNPIIPTTLRVFGVAAAPEPYFPMSTSVLQRTKVTNNGPQLVVIYELGVCNLMQLLVS